MQTLIYTSAILATAVAVGHSVLGERKLIGPLLADTGSNSRLLSLPRNRRLLRGVWHLPSILWIIAAAMTVSLAIQEAMAPTPYLFAAGFYATGGIANLVTIRKPHIGSVGLSCAAIILILGIYG